MVKDFGDRGEYGSSHDRSHEIDNNGLFGL
jgi:hypothetical protein